MCACLNKKSAEISFEKHFIESLLTGINCPNGLRTFWVYNSKYELIKMTEKSVCIHRMHIRRRVYDSKSEKIDLFRRFFGKWPACKMSDTNADNIGLYYIQCAPDWSLDCDQENESSLKLDLNQNLPIRFRFVLFFSLVVLKDTNIFQSCYATSGCVGPRKKLFMLSQISNGCNATEAITVNFQKVNRSVS